MFVAIFFIPFLTIATKRAHFKIIESTIVIDRNQRNVPFGIVRRIYRNICYLNLVHIHRNVRTFCENAHRVPHQWIIFRFIGDIVFKNTVCNRAPKGNFTVLLHKYACTAAANRIVLPRNLLTNTYNGPIRSKRACLKINAQFKIVIYFAYIRHNGNINRICRRINIPRAICSTFFQIPAVRKFITTTSIL